MTVGAGGPRTSNMSRAAGVVQSRGLRFDEIVPRKCPALSSCRQGPAAGGDGVSSGSDELSRMGASGRRVSGHRRRLVCARLRRPIPGQRDYGYGTVGDRGQRLRPRRSRCRRAAVQRRVSHAVRRERPVVYEGVPRGHRRLQRLGLHMRRRGEVHGRARRSAHRFDRGALRRLLRRRRARRRRRSSGSPPAVGRATPYRCSRGNPRRAGAPSPCSSSSGTSV